MLLSHDSNTEKLSCKPSRGGDVGIDSSGENSYSRSTFLALPTQNQVPKAERWQHYHNTSPLHFHPKTETSKTKRAAGPELQNTSMLETQHQEPSRGSTTYIEPIYLCRPHGNVKKPRRRHVLISPSPPKKTKQADTYYLNASKHILVTTYAGAPLRLYEHSSLFIIAEQKKKKKEKGVIYRLLSPGAPSRPDRGRSRSRSLSRSRPLCICKSRMSRAGALIFGRRTHTTAVPPPEQARRKQEDVKFITEARQHVYKTQNTKYFVHDSKFRRVHIQSETVYLYICSDTDTWQQ